MEHTKDLTDAVIAGMTPEIRSLVTTVKETGETVSIQISTPDENEITVADLLNDAITALELKVDKSAPPKDLVISNDVHYESIFEKLRQDKIGEAMVSQTLKPFTSLFYRIHRTLTGKENEYAKYYRDRIAVYDDALVARRKAVQRLKEETEAKLREQARAEDEERRANEARILREKAAKEKRPELEERAREVESRPARDINVTTNIGLPKTAKGGFRDRFKANCEDEEALIRAIGKPEAYREIAAWISATYGKNAFAKKLAAEIKLKAAELPDIPCSVLKVQEGKLTANANATNGKMQWPGVSIIEDTKTTTRR